tara:strand:- start:3 stop:659 length:657 start_codon:yes stop_codon:yes gene_type:complete
MAYFEQLPDISYVSLLPKTNNNDERITVKNIFKRAKLRSDLDEVITGFNYYIIKDDTRPDIIAQNIYGDPELDWVVLITNNILNIRDQWPLNNNDLYDYMLSKYGSVPKLDETHHWETTKITDSYGRILLKEGMVVDKDFSFTYNISNTVKTANPTKEITNRDYEIEKNENKRKIKVLKPEYLSAFMSDMRNIMKYETSSQYINRTTKAAYNPNTTGV